jgi:hypothetical protein
LLHAELVSDFLKQKDNLHYRDFGSTYKILKCNGVKYRKTRDRGKFLMKKGDTVPAHKFLQTLHNPRIAGYECLIFCLDETWINQNCSRKYIRHDASRKGSLRVPPQKGRS